MCLVCDRFFLPCIIYLLFIFSDGNYTLFEDKKNWCQALQYCRHVSADLVSISNGSQNEEVIKKGNNTSFWIGLMHDEWEWVDKSCSLYRNWSDESYLSDHEDNCTILRDLGLLKNHNCGNLAYPVCSKGKQYIEVKQNLILCYT